MVIAQTVRIRMTFFIFLNLLMAIACIWSLSRMAPAVQNIIHKNDRSIVICEKMFVVLIKLTNNKDESHNKIFDFEKLLELASNNITEENEEELIDQIKVYYKYALNGDIEALEKTVEKISSLSEINRKAINAADKVSKKFAVAGSWFVVFWAAGMFFLGMYYKRVFLKDIIYPYEEINAVLNANLTGDKFRRCSGHEAVDEINGIYSKINMILDKKSAGLESESDR